MLLYVDAVVVGYDMSQPLTQRIGRFDSKLGTILAAAQMCWELLCSTLLRKLSHHKGVLELWLEFGGDIVVPMGGGYVYAL